ncbi:MAG: hypothetical protein LUG18_03255, partial [Candidatus Azobacteroides sp.]|nr:hypothetical protein [Candidatus Azobacteroides sp.]
MKSLYCLQKNVFRLWIVMVCIFPFFSLFSQPKANPDNVFVSPIDPYVFWDVLKNDIPGDCLAYETLQMEIVTQPNHMLLCYVESNYIFYMPDGVFAGRDSLEYEITCNGQSSRAKVYINLSDMPDNITPEVCHVPIPPIGWEIKELTRSEELVSVCCIPLCGDVDGDGEVEILIKNAIVPGDYGPSDKIYIFSINKEDNQIYLKDSIMTVPTSAVSQFVMANVDGGKYTSVFVTTDTRSTITEQQLLVKYSYNEITLQYEEAWRVSYSTHPDYPGGIPVIADFAGDGRTQVVVYDKVFNAVDGTLLADGGYQGNDYYSFGRIGHVPVYKGAGRWTATCMTAADIDGDGLPEVIGGDCVYKVTITNHFGTEGNSFDFMVKADTTGRTDVGDGAIAVADMDLDGQLDVVVTHKMPLTDPSITDKGSVYIYNPRTGEIMNNNVIDDIPIRPGNERNLVGPSIPFLGDVDNDGYPEIALTGRYIMTAYKYNPTTKMITQLWSRVTSDESASTTMSLFDFTQSGEAQLVYRDEDSLRIINGATGVTLAGYTKSASGTVDEYPIVADVNGDGAAEIIVASNDGNVNSLLGSLRIYTSAGIPWAAARTVWNRMDYNPVYVNEDLTIPRYPLNPSTPFFSESGVVRPFNNYLQQATRLNDEGEMLYEASDLQFDPYKRPVLIIDDTGNNVSVDLKIGNIGDKDFYPPLSVSLYVYDSSSDFYTHLNTTVLNDTVLMGTTKEINYDITGYSTLPFPATYDHWLLFLNSGEDAPSAPVYPYQDAEPECSYWNNRSANLSFTYGERIMCEGESEEVTLSPDGVYSYKWYDAATGGNLLSEGDSYTVTKDAAIVQRYFVDTYSKSTGAKLNAIRDTVHIYLTPDSLIWNGLEDSDWHNFANWNNPSVTGSDPYPRRNIPRKCTNVLVPDGLVRYPDLRDAAGIGTSYGEYAVAGCRYITFSHGGEVSRTDLLDYEGARVELTMNANRWYMLSAPLRSLYTGDFYEVDANPHLDNVEVYTRLYRTANPQTGETSTDEWGWSGVFHNPHYQMGPGRGVSFWLDNRQAMDVVTSHTFTFPKSEEYYHIYARAGHIHATVPLSRNGVQERFVYEGVQDASDNIPLDALCTESGGQLIVGNPFMGHWDFHRFYEANSAYIKDYYKVLTEHGTFETYTITGAETGTGTGTPALSRYIPPMQSVLVESRVPFSTGTL